LANDKLLHQLAKILLAVVSGTFDLRDALCPSELKRIAPDDFFPAEWQGRVDAPEEADLLYVLLNDLNINGSKLGCGRSQCGSCTVLVDGEPVRSCVTPTKAIAGHDVTTLEGLMVNGEPSRLQAFIDEQAAQCGYCTAGIIMEAHALLERNPHPTDAEIRSAEWQPLPMWNP
jgi:nicotinate dehydrogenase subunit A